MCFGFWRYFAGDKDNDERMNKLSRIWLLGAAVAGTLHLSAEELPKDTLKIVNMDEVLVVASPKENRQLRELPSAGTALSQSDMRGAQVSSIKSLNTLVPNIFIPDYGSRLTSAIYIRGVGSRINTPSVGLYVDNVAYIDKSAFDFNYSDIERIEVLRGPQGTLYGRNTMGGLIMVHTKSPFSYQGTDVKLGASTYGSANVSFTHYHRNSQRFAFSAGGFYEHQGGYFRNSALENKKVDNGDAGGARLRAIYLPSANTKINASLSYEQSNEGGYPYFYTGVVSGEESRADKIGLISCNEESGYRRKMVNAGLSIEHQADNFTLDAVTGYQYLNDKMFLDQDFTERDIFNLEQRQKLNVFSEELSLKSKPGCRYQWTTGLFTFYQWLNTNGPVNFKEDGIEQLITSNINSNIPNMAPRATMSVNVDTAPLNVSGDFDTPVYNGALFHQSTFHDLLFRGFSATVGLRLDYEHTSMTYHSTSSLDYTFNMGGMMVGRDISVPLNVSPLIAGRFSDDYLQLLPKLALQYDFRSGAGNIYATASKGYRSGGYNVQMFSDLVQSYMQNGMKEQVKQTVADIFDQVQGMPQTVKDMILGYIPDADENPDVRQATTYKPEYTWNYELGTHLNLCNGKLELDAALFYMDTRNQQVARFSDNGLGRITTNAGRSHSYGAEASVRMHPSKSLTINADYGYTHATFSKYKTNVKVDGVLTEVDYTDNYVPFVPMHTLNVGGQYVWNLAKSAWLDCIQLNANYNAAGRIYWTENNSAKQNFYGTFNARVAFERSNVALALWGKNLAGSDYTTFYFESMGNGFRQKSAPRRFGIEVRLRF
jgi:outer membrane receptor protein involved in Fe transport